jgi:hypothetical protein
MTGDDGIPCPGCGALVADIDGPTHAYIGAAPGCWALYGELSARQYVDPAAAPVRKLAVDAYAVQHPGVPGRRQSQSVWVHLIALCLSIEHGFSPETGIRAMTRQLDLERDYGWLEPPRTPYEMTIVDVLKADPGEGQPLAVRRWAEATWLAWADHHEAIRGRARNLIAG